MPVLQVRPRRISIPKQEEHTKEQKTEKKIQREKLVVREHHRIEGTKYYGTWVAGIQQERKNN